MKQLSVAAKVEKTTNKVEKVADRTNDIAIGAEKIKSDVTIHVDSKGNAIIGDWSSTKKLTSPENALAHWQKHSTEFPEYTNASQYVDGAQKFVSNPPSSVMTKMRDRDTLLYDPNSNTFAVKTDNGVPRTMFRPKNGIDYWNRQ